MGWFNMTKKKQETLTKRMETMECEVDVINSKFNSIIRNIEETRGNALNDYLIDKEEVNKRLDKIRKELDELTTVNDLKVVGYMGGGILLFLSFVWLIAHITAEVLQVC
jgi:chaperonin cofactor prefoldin